MLGIKNINHFLLLLLILTVLGSMGFLAARNGSWPGKVKQELFRLMVGQEISLKTAHFSQMSTAHYKIKYLPVDAEYAQMVASAAEDAYSSVSNMLGQEPARRTTVIIYPDNASLARSFGWDKNQKAMGVYWGGSIRILSPGAWMTDAGDQQLFMKEGPMVHELAHLLVDEMSHGNYNRWWTEGIAQYAEKKITGFEFSSPFENQQDLNYYTLEELQDNFDQLEQSVAYWESLKAVEYIAGKYGEDKIYAILRQCGEGDSMPAAVEKSLGMDYAGFEYDFYQYLDNM